MLRFVGCLLLAVLWNCQSVLAEEVRIGHLETNDDTGINWLYFNCQKSGSAQMQCDILQTLISKKKTDVEIDAELKELNGTDSLAQFNKIFGEGCKSLVANEGKLRSAQKSGIGVDGKPVNLRIAAAGWPMMFGMLDVCKTPTQESASRFFKLTTDEERRSCKVHTFMSKASFTFIRETNSWTTKEGPTGPCGTFVLGTLTQDQKTSFWSYVEKTLRTNPKGVLPLGQSCSLFPEHTANYSWRTTRTLAACDFIESEPD
ncbi:hypothetical protein AB8Z38_02510 [Bradyrhizobium sp. LLZ17]|uniref:Uncharacterized protein n=1 Tax=Bradyrhizobium sp. LLZ17 TaxID=3239388 RepID=A0AB39XKK8_9BRAD